MAWDAVGIIGLGRIARTHAEALRVVAPSATVIGVDPAGGEAPAAGLVDEVLGGLPGGADLDAVDLWVVATPTHDHQATCRELLTGTERALVLIEKPLVPRREDLASLERAVGRATLDVRLRVSHHFAFSPEVRWAAGPRESLRLGTPTRVTMSFHDPYSGLHPVARASYGDPWVDSGPNQISVLKVLTGADLTLEEVEVSSDGKRAHARGRLGQDGSVTLLSSWRAVDTSKGTVVAFEDGTEVWLDHTAVTGVALRSRGPVAAFDPDPTVSRKQAHYRPLHRALVSGVGDEALRYPFAADVVRHLDVQRAIWPDIRPDTRTAT